MDKNILIIMQTVDREDSTLGAFHEWVRILTRYMAKISIIVLQKGSIDLPNHVKVYSLGKEYKKPKWKQLFRFYQLIITLRNEYEYVIVHMTPIWVLVGYPFWNLYGKKIALWYAHGHADMKLRIANRLVDKVFTSTPEGYRIKSDKVFVVGQGIDTDFFSPRLLTSKDRANEYRIISVGRMSPVKDYTTLLKAVVLLKKQKQNISMKVLIFGAPKLVKDYKYYSQLENEIRIFKLENIVELKGGVSYQIMPEVYSNAHILVNTSLTGSADKVVLEAMASGINVLSCNDAYQNILGEKYTFPKGDFRELAKKLDYFYSHRDVSDKLRKKVITDHNINTLIKRIVAQLK